MQRGEVRKGRLAPAVMALGGATSFVGSLLTWASVRLKTVAARTKPAKPGTHASPRGAGRAGSSFTLTGLNTPGGKTVLALGVALILVALFALLAYWFWLRLGAMAIGLVLGVIALVSTAVNLASPASMLGAVRLQLVRRGIPATAGVGLYLALAGSALAVIAAAAWLVVNRDRWATFATVGGGPAPTRPDSPDERPTTPLPPTTSPGLASE